MNDITFNFVPTSIDEAIRISKIMADSTMIPKAYQGKPGDVFVAIQMGAEVGLKPVQAVQSIVSINNVPTIWGDASLALVKSSPDFEGIEESYDDDTKTAICIISRKGESPVKRTFSETDARESNLLNKPGPWKLYRKRMLQLRARSWAIRDCFPHVLKGLQIAEEVRDYEEDQQSLNEKITPQRNSFFANKIVSALEKYGVTKEMIENKYGKSVEDLSDDDLNSLRADGISLREGHELEKLFPRAIKPEDLISSIEDAKTKDEVYEVIDLSRELDNNELIVQAGHERIKELEKDE